MSSVASPSGFTVYKRHLQPARPRDLSEASSARWLVTLEPGSEGRAQALCQRLGSGSAAGQGGLGCHGVLTRVGLGMVVQGAEGDLHEGLADLSDAVVGVYEDQELYITGRLLQQTGSNAQTEAIVSLGSNIGQFTHLDRIDQRNPPLDSKYIYYSQGTGANVFIADTGVFQCHPEFLKSGSTQTDCQSNASVSRVNFKFNAFSSESPNDTGTIGHGTHVASLAAGNQAGVAKSANIYSFKVVQDSGSGSYTALTQGVDSMLTMGAQTPPLTPAVVNMSLGSAGNNSDSSRLLKNLVQARILPVVAAGNDGVDACTSWPSASAWGITVGASRADSAAYMDALASFSNVGKCVDIFAPGVNDVGACNESSSAECGSGPWHVLSGTSMATPIVAGSAASYLALHTEIDILALKHIVESLTATSGAITQHASKGTTNLVYSRALTKKALTATVQLWDITTRVGSTSVGLQLAAQPAADVTVAVSSTWSGVTVSPASLTFTSSNWNQAQTVNVNVSMDGGALARPMYDASGNATGQTGVVEPTSAAYLGPASVFIDAVASSSDGDFGGGPRGAMPRRDRQALMCSLARPCRRPSHPQMRVSIRCDWRTPGPLWVTPCRIPSWSRSCPTRRPSASRSGLTTWTCRRRASRAPSRAVRTPTSPSKPPPTAAASSAWLASHSATAPTTR